MTRRKSPKNPPNDATQGDVEVDDAAVTKDPSTHEPSLAESPVAEPATADTPPADSPTAKPSAIEPSIKEPSATEHSAKEPSATEYSAKEPSAGANPVEEPSATESASSELSSRPEPAVEDGSEQPPREGASTVDATESATAASNGENRAQEPNRENPPNTPPAAVDTGRRPARTGALAALVAVIVSAAMVGAGGYYVWQQLELSQEQVSAELAALARENQQQQQTLNQMASTVEQQRGEVQQALQAQVSDARQQLQNQIQQQDTQINRLKERVDGHQQRLLSLSTTSREDWLLAEAEYLLKLANQRVLLERLPSNAIALLEAADAIIKQVAGGMGDVELFMVREALADELSALKLIDPVDKEGIYLQLNSLARAIDDLPRVPDHSLTVQPPTQTQESRTVAPESGDTEQDQWWQRLWAEVKGMAGLLDNYIKIEDAERPAQPLIDQYTSQAAVLNVRLLLEQAQVALLKEQPVAYRQSLQQAQTLIDDYFISSPAAQEVLESLQQLQSIEIAPPLPDISRSLKLLNNYVRQLHKLEPAAEGQL